MPKIFPKTSLRQVAIPREIAAANKAVTQELSSKKILITGGTSALGSAFVTLALQQSASVYFTYDQNEQKAKQLQAQGAVGFKLDLSKTAGIDLFVKECKSAAGSLDVLVHNAAAVRDHTLQNLTEEEWDYVMAVDLKAPYYLTKKLLPLLFKKTPSPKKIFMITSRAAVMGGIGISNYAAAKAGLIGLTKSLAQELGKKNILVNAINPGFMKSRMTENIPEVALQQHLDLSPVQRYSDPNEVAAFVCYLASDQMTQATGQVFHFESRKIS